jgi:multiple antibiotic resistance protein
VAIINPLGVAFVFRRLTIWATPSERAQLSTRIALYAMAVILGSYFFGRFVLGFFGITLPALRIAGGIIVALSGWQLLNRFEQPAAPEATNNASPVRMAFFPLTMPLTAGPGTITVAIALGAARAERSGIGVIALMEEVIARNRHPIDILEPAAHAHPCTMLGVVQVSRGDVASP